LIAHGIFNRVLSSKSITSTKVTEYADVVKQKHSLKIIVPFRNPLKIKVNRSYKKEFNRWEATFSLYGSSELIHKPTSDVIQTISLQEIIKDKFYAYGSINFEHESNITLLVYVVNPDGELSGHSKHSKCINYNCENVIMEEKDYTFPYVEMIQIKNETQQLVDCNNEKENFKFGFVISAGIAFMLFIVSLSLIINAIRVYKTLEKFSAYESTSW